MSFGGGRGLWVGSECEFCDSIGLWCVMNFDSKDWRRKPHQKKQ